MMLTTRRFSMLLRIRALLFSLALATVLAPAFVQAATIKQLNYETITSAMTTELNSLGTNSRAISAALGADATAANLLGDWELTVDFVSAPTVDGLIDLYLVRSADGTNYEDGDATNRPVADAFGCSFQVLGTTAAQRLVCRDVVMPPGLYKAIIWNNSSQAFPASGSTLKVRTHNRQVN